jgi:hypothetical protein
MILNLMCMMRMGLLTNTTIFHPRSFYKIKKFYKKRTMRMEKYN